MKNPPPLALSELLIVINKKKRRGRNSGADDPWGSASISNFACHGWDQSVCDSKEEMKRQIINKGGGLSLDRSHLLLPRRKRSRREADTVVCGDERFSGRTGWRSCARLEHQEQKELLHGWTGNQTQRGAKIKRWIFIQNWKLPSLRLVYVWMCTDVLSRQQETFFVAYLRQ